MDAGMIAAAVFAFGTGIWFVGDTEMCGDADFFYGDDSYAIVPLVSSEAPKEILL